MLRFVGVAGGLAAMVVLAGADAPVRSAMSIEAEIYLDHALDLLEHQALDRHTVDWERVRADAFATAEGAREPAETHTAIRTAIRALGERHTMLWSAGAVTTVVTDSTDVPRGELLDGRIARINIPSLSADQTGTDRYITEGRAVVETLDAAAPCGWLIDLKSNSGGDMWPMLTVLAPLLGDGPLGTSVEPDGMTTPWALRDGDVLLGDQVMDTNPYQLTRPAPPLAVLTSGNTGSSGEAVLVATRGLDRARTFGSATSGLTTVNEPHTLADGAVLLLTTAVMADRSGRHYRGPISPDEQVGRQDGADVAAAAQWLLSRPACGGPVAG